MTQNISSVETLIIQAVTKHGSIDRKAIISSVQATNPDFKARKISDTVTSLVKKASLVLVSGNYTVPAPAKAKKTVKVAPTAEAVKSIQRATKSAATVVIFIEALDGTLLKDGIVSAKQGRTIARRLSKTQDVNLVRDGQRTLYQNGGQV